MENMTDIEQLRTARAESWYTIIGAGGEPQEWIDGYEKLLEEQEIGKPVAWYATTGAAVNSLGKPSNPRNAFPLDLTFLMFPLEGLNVGKLAMFKLRMEDRWFDDVLANMR